MRLIICSVLIAFISGCSGIKPYIEPYQYQENQTAMLLYERALAYQKMGNLDLALIEFRHYVDLYGHLYRSDEAQFTIAQIYEKLEQWNEAIDNYKILIKRYKRSDYVPEAMFKMGACCQKTQEWQEAVDTYIKIIERYYRTPWSSPAKEEINKIINQLKGSKWARKMQIKVNKLVRKKQRQ